MSADNGIYILQSKDGYRVIHAQAIENLYWWGTETRTTSNWEKRSELNPKELIRYFGKSKVFKTDTEVFTEATRLYEKTLLIEYGINFIRGWEDKDFPK